MVNRMAKVKPIYAFATTLYSVAWGVLFSFTTRYIAVELNGGIRAIVLFTALNWGFTLFGLLAGKVASILGERRTTLLGSTCSIPVVAASFLKDPFLLSTIVSTTTLPWVLSWSVIVKSFFTQAGGNYGREYSEYTIGIGLGFFIGSILTGLLYAVSGSISVFIACTFLLIIPPLIYYKYYPIRADLNVKEVDPSIKPVVKKLAGALISLSLIVFSRELLYSIAPSRLDVSIDLVIPGLENWLKYTIYGMIYSGGALISPLVRFFAGRLVDRYGSVKTYVSTVLAYTAIYWLFVETEGLTPILVWQIPLYPFLDTSFNVYVAQNLESEQLVSGFGATQAFTAIGGLMLTPLLLTQEINLRVAGLIVTLINVASIGIMTSSRSSRASTIT